MFQQLFIIVLWVKMAGSAEDESSFIPSEVGSVGGPSLLFQSNLAKQGGTVLSRSHYMFRLSFLRNAHLGENDTCTSMQLA